MGYFAIKRLIKINHELDLAYQNATLSYIQACKKAGIWDDNKALQVMIEQVIHQRSRIY